MTGIATKVVEEIVVALGGRVVVMKRWEKKGRTTRKRMIRLNIVAVVVVDVVVVVQKGMFARKCVVREGATEERVCC